MAQAAADGPSAESPGRSLDPVSDGRARGMVVTPSVPRRRDGAGTEFGLRLAATLFLMTPMTLALTAVPLVAASRCRSDYVAAQQQLPPGQIRPRPAEGREPEFPPPNIRDYKPRSTLVVPQHPVPRAKFPVVDIHGHPPNLTGPDAVNLVGDAMDR